MIVPKPEPPWGASVIAWRAFLPPSVLSSGACTTRCFGGSVPIHAFAKRMLSRSESCSACCATIVRFGWFVISPLGP